MIDFIFISIFLSEPTFQVSEYQQVLEAIRSVICHPVLLIPARVKIAKSLRAALLASVLIVVTTAVYETAFY